MLQDKTVDEIHVEILNNIDDSYDKTIGYLTYDATRAVAIQEKALYDSIKSVYEKVNIENLQGDELERFINQRKGISRKAATYSEGKIKVIGNGTVSQGAIFETEAGTQFQASETVMINGSGEVKIKAIESGSIGNVGANTIIKIPVTIAGINSINNPFPIIGGYAAESDSNLLDRYYLALRTPPTSGNKYHYLSWAKEIEGVGDAKVFPLERGANTVEVVIIDADMKPATDNLIQKVQEYIDPNSKGIGEGVAPIGARCYIITASGVGITINANISLMAGYVLEDVKKDIEDKITTYIKELTFNKNNISYAKIGAIIIETEGVNDYANLKINNKTSNIEIGDKEVFVLNSVTLGVV